MYIINYCQAMKHDMFFRKHPVFTIDDLKKYLSSHGQPGQRTHEALLAYYRKTGRVIQIRRGLYAVIPKGADPENHPVDLFLVAGKMTQDSILSYHTSLEYFGKAYSVFTQIIYSASRPPNAFIFRSHRIQGTKFPKALLQKNKEHMEVSTEDRKGLKIRVATLERTLVDVLDRPYLSGSWEEIWRSLESIEFFNLDSVVEYALTLENKTTAAKVGFFLEQHSESLMVKDYHLDSLQKLRPCQPHYMERTKRKSGSYNSDWNLVVPNALIDPESREII